MSDAKKLLEDPKIAEWMNNHQGCEDEVRAAAKILCNKNDALKALNKLLSSLCQRKLNVFFSYKTKDEPTAKTIVEELEKYSANILQVTYQARFPEKIAGKNWRKLIKDAVCRANWFILLLPDPNVDWDWCLYETGLFESQYSSADSLICLHHPEIKMPDQISDYQGIPAEQSKVEGFLRMIFINDNPIPGLPAINKGIEKDIPDLAKKIINAINPPIVRQFYEPWVSLKIENSKSLEDKNDLDKAIIESSNKQALRIFDFETQPATWGDLRQVIKEHKGDSRWREELFHVIRKIAQGRLFHPIQAVFESASGKLCRPIVNGVDRIGPEGPISIFHITFIEDVGVIEASSIPRELSILGTLLRITFRFRWEILEKFCKRAMTLDDIERLENTFQRMEKDWESRGIGDSNDIPDLFKGEQKKHVWEMFINWDKIRNKEGTGELDIAMENKNLKEIQEILNKIYPNNQKFLEIVSQRFNEFILSKKIH